MDEKTIDEMSRRHMELKLRQLELENEGQRIRNEQQQMWLEFQREKQVAEMNILIQRLHEEQEHYRRLAETQKAIREYWQMLKEKKIAPH